MNSFKLLRFSDNKQIPVFNLRMPNKKAYCTNGMIALDYSRIESERECKRLLAEELGHVLCDAMYTLSDCDDRLKAQNIAQQEHRANVCAVRLKVPLRELKIAISSSLDDYEIAETLDIDLPELTEAVEYYKVKGLL